MAMEKLGLGVRAGAEAERECVGAFKRRKCVLRRETDGAGVSQDVEARLRGRLGRTPAQGKSWVRGGLSGETYSGEREQEARSE